MSDSLAVLTRSIPFRAGVLLFLSLLLLAPLGGLRELVAERRGLRAAAASSIAAGWGDRQTLLGPVLVLALECPWRDDEGRTGVTQQIATRLPSRFSVEGDLATEVRRRGLHAVPVYRARLRTAFEFTPPAGELLELQCAGARLRAASVVFAVSDPRGIDRISALEEATAAGLPPMPWLPGTSLSGPFKLGVQAALPVERLAAGAAPIPLRTEIDLRGSDRFTLIPAGSETAVRLRADWPSPSFDGAFLPATSDLRADGFEATWAISELARPLPAIFTGDPPAELWAAAFGFTWFQPADGYLMTERSLKYGFLFVILTFLVFFGFELTADRRVHPLQYGLVGGALCIFYLLLLSLSERAGFGAAYLAAAAATTVQIALYGRALLGKTGRAAVLGAILVGLYGGLFLLIGLEETALLVGSVALFALLTIAMWFTRRVGQDRRQGREAASAPGGAMPPAL